MEIVRQAQQQPAPSPFDSLRRTQDGREFWTARDMQQLLGYVRWSTFQGALERLALSLQNSGENPTDHVHQSVHMVELGSGAKREVTDFQLSRRAAYLLAMNGDPRNPEVAMAQRYFAEQTRRAELAQAEAVRQELSMRGRAELVLEAKQAAIDDMAGKVCTAAQVAQAYGGGKKKALDQLSLKGIHPVGYFVSMGAEFEVYPMLDVFQQFRAGGGPPEGRRLDHWDMGWTPYPERQKYTLSGKAG